MKWIVRCLAALMLFGLVHPQPVEAQLLKKIKNKAKRKAEQRIDRKIDRAIDESLDAVECLVTDPECIAQAEQDGKEVKVVDANGDPVPPAEANRAKQAARKDDDVSKQKPGQGAWANYDFVPGHRVLFFDDFEEEYVGDVPRSIAFSEGVMEVVEENGNQMLRFADASAFALPLPESLPERFTIEFDMYSGDNRNSLVLGTGPLAKEGPLSKEGDYSCFHGDLRNHAAAEFRVGNIFETGVHSESGGSSLQKQDAHEQGMVPVRIAVDGSYVKMYVGENRVANVPNADIQRTDRVLVTTCGDLAAVDDNSKGPIFLDNFRVAEGGRERMYETLSSEGRVVTRGILFDTGSARIRPESTPTLKEIGRTLEKHGDLRLRIEGHTDNTGSADVNKRLSQERAEAVRAHLVAEYGVAADRLEAVGYGPEQPATSNDTAEGRQTNRRVELVKLDG